MARTLFHLHAHDLGSRSMRTIPRTVTVLPGAITISSNPARDGARRRSRLEPLLRRLMVSPGRWCALG